MRNKGITLIALIITIIVMLILVAVVINVSLSGELFNKAKEATYSYEIERKKENLADYEVEYYLKTGLILGDTIKEAIAKISIETGVDENKFIAFHDKAAINNNNISGNNKVPETFIFYNWKKASLDEIKKLEEITIDNPKKYEEIYLFYNRCLVYDINGDGYVDVNDYNDINRIALLSNSQTDFVEGNKNNYYKELCKFENIQPRTGPIGNLNRDEVINAIDVAIMDDVIKGESIFYNNQAKYEEYVVFRHFNYYTRNAP